ncbi:hypothetical protein HAX54_027794 [Datura stramonium]|uniref:Uncharacterized protein n=1 Tax=Datura stramonium TaxID=4076 RepID=A0ABS8V5D5_DATST|nr:hypothetical protein [Datura stramonium]
MIAEHRLYFPIILFIYLLFPLSQFALSQPLWDYNTSLSNSTAGLSRAFPFWINRPSLIVNSTTDGYFGLTTPILQRCWPTIPLLLLLQLQCHQMLSWYTFVSQQIRPGESDMINKPQLVWSANRNHPVKANATLQLEIKMATWS